MAAKSVSEKQGGVGVKAPHLTLICPFPMEAGPTAHTPFSLTMFSCLCSVPAPSSEEAVGEASACPDAFCVEDGGCPCAAPCTALLRSMFPGLDFGAAFKMR